jgi:hypothetical protein
MFTPDKETEHPQGSRKNIRRKMKKGLYAPLSGIVAVGKFVELFRRIRRVRVETKKGALRPFCWYRVPRE